MQQTHDLEKALALDAYLGTESNRAEGNRHDTLDVREAHIV
jgi:hypothetical protein